MSAPARHNYMESPGEEPPFAVMASWTAEHRSFAVKTYFKNNESPITVQRIFHRHFRLGSYDRVPNHRTIVRWVNHFRTTASSLKEKSPGHPRSQRTPAWVEDMETSTNQHSCRIWLPLISFYGSIWRAKSLRHALKHWQTLRNKALQEIPFDMLHHVMRAFRSPPGGMHTIQW